MRVVHIYWSLSLGGIETMLVNIVNKQAALLDKVYVIIINDNINNELLAKINPKVKIVLLRRKVGSFIGFPALKINLFLATHKIDIIHSHYNEIIKIIYPTFRHKCVVTLHAISKQANSSELYRYKRIFSISNSVRDSLKSLKGLNSTVIYNGIDFEVFSRISKSDGNTKFRIVAVSRLLHEIKGQDLLIKAIALLSPEDKNKIILDIIGDGPSYKFLNELIQKLELSDYIHLLGEKSQQYLSENLCNYNLFVQPSYREGFGLTVVEAMASHVPVLVSENQGPLEIINNGDYGFLFKNGSIEDCSRMISEIVNKTDCSYMIEAAYKYAFENFNIERTSRKYIEEYATLLKDK